MALTTLSYLTATGTTRTDAFALTGANAFIFTTVAAGTGAVFNTATTGTLAQIFNQGTNALTVYPGLGGTIQNAATHVIQPRDSINLLSIDGISWLVSSYTTFTNTYTPVPSFSTSGACGVSTNSGSYSINDNLCTVRFTTIIAAGAASGNFQMSLPIMPSGASTDRWSGSGYMNNAASFTYTGTLVPEVQGGLQQARFKQVASGSLASFVSDTNFASPTDGVQVQGTISYLIA